MAADDPNDENINPVTSLLALGGMVAIVVGSVTDITSCAGEVRAYNAGHHNISIAPAVLTPPSGPVIGLGIGGEF